MGITLLRFPFRVSGVSEISSCPEKATENSKKADIKKNMGAGTLDKSYAGKTLPV